MNELNQSVDDLAAIIARQSRDGQKPRDAQSPKTPTDVWLDGFATAARKDFSTPPTNPYKDDPQRAEWVKGFTFGQHARAVVGGRFQL